MELRPLNRSDITTLMAFRDLADWNQTQSDWERVVKLNPTGCFAAEIGGTLIGFVCTMNHPGGVGSIGALFVTPLHRRQGGGTRLFEAAIAHLEARGARTLRLTTPPQWRGMFEKHGFEAECEIDRWVLHRETILHPSWAKTSFPDMEKILDLDREIYGADRSELLKTLHADAPDFTLTSEIEGEVIGYGMGRGGSHADQLGPWVAWDQPTARELLEEFLRRSGRNTIIVDSPKTNEMARGLLLSMGFRISRPALRMVRGLHPDVGRTELICGFLGPDSP